jgi:lactoylglutathione lyase
MKSIHNYLGAVGIGVSDLNRSVDFYTRIFGLKKVWKLRLPHMHEVILNSEGDRGSSLVLMNYIDGSNHQYTNNPVKLVFYMADPKECVEMIRRDGLEIIREATPVPELRDAVVGLAKDPDGYLLEILQAEARA